MYIRKGGRKAKKKESFPSSTKSCALIPDDHSPRQSNPQDALYIYIVFYISLSLRKASADVYSCVFYFYFIFLILLYSSIWYKRLKIFFLTLSHISLSRRVCILFYTWVLIAFLPEWIEHIGHFLIPSSQQEERNWSERISFIISIASPQIFYIFKLKIFFQFVLLLLI
jgi:hypothetical protein